MPAIELFDYSRNKAFGVLKAVEATG